MRAAVPEVDYTLPFGWLPRSAEDLRNNGKRDGAPPIELVDGEQLVRMFERAELGLQPRQTYEVDVGFFEEFRK